MDWNARLKRAEKRERFTEVDLRLACQWDTCAVGERAQHLDKSPFVRYRQGRDFMNCVSENRVPDARACYTQIQKWGA